MSELSLHPHALVMFNVGKPWSEDIEGISWDDWWKKTFGTHHIDVGNVTMSEQQFEWVCAISTRPGVDATLKPFSALSEEAKQSYGTQKQPPGSGVVKVILKQFFAFLPDRAPGDELCKPTMITHGDKAFFVFPLNGVLKLKPVSRDCLERSRPDTMHLLFTDADDFKTLVSTAVRLLEEQLNVPRKPEDFGGDISKKKAKTSAYHQRACAFEHMKAIMVIARNSASTTSYHPMERLSTQTNPVNVTLTARAFNPQDILDVECLTIA